MNKENTPRKFYHESEKTPSAKTVGELIEILKELPKDALLEDAPLEDGGYEVVVYNISGEFGGPFVAVERIY